MSEYCLGYEVGRRNRDGRCSPDFDAEGYTAPLCEASKWSRTRCMVALKWNMFAQRVTGLLIDARKSEPPRETTSAGLRRRVNKAHERLSTQRGL